MKKYVLFLNFVLFLAVSVGNYFYITGGELVVKSITSVLFVIAGGVNLAYVMSQKSGRIGFAVCLVSGLFFSMLGDIVLGISFIGGAALFAVGHIMYLLSYGKIMPFRMADFVIGGAIFVGSLCFLLFSPIVGFSSGIIKTACVIYAFIISMMVGKSLCNMALQKNMLTTVIAIGSVLFFFSDLMLVFDNFTNLNFPSGILCLATYYPAQCVLAFGVMIGK